MGKSGPTGFCFLSFSHQSYFNDSTTSGTAKDPWLSNKGIPRGSVLLGKAPFEFTCFYFEIGMKGQMCGIHHLFCSHQPFRGL